MKVIETRFNNGKYTTVYDIATFKVDDGHQETHIINLYPTEKFQTLLGFGGAFTESAGFVFSKTTPEMQK